MKSILLFANDDGDVEARLQVTLDLARAFGAHITCLQITPIEALVVADPYRGAYAMVELLKAFREREEVHRANVERRLAGEGITWDWLHVEGDPVQSTINRASLADLMVLGLPTGSKGLSFISAIAVHARTPIFAVPQQCRSFASNGTALVAWNGSPESSHALRASVPLLAKAKKVQLVTVSDDQSGFPATEGAEYLSRHGIHAELDEWPRQGQRVSDCLFEAASTVAPTYLIAGAYGHTRFREAVLGGVTRELIQFSPLPLFLAH
jgi:nucleotide-binding universal stress UspA family protein